MRNNRKTIAAALATLLASLSLYPVFSGIGWFWAGAGAIIVVAIAGTLTRLRRLPVVANLGGTLIGLLLYLNLEFESGRSLLYVLPTLSSLSHLWGLAGQGISESAKYAPPVPELSGMILLLVGGVGLTAIFTDLIAVRLGSAALAGLPMLMLFTEPFTLSIRRGGLGTTIAFCLGTIGYLTMLSTEGRERIRIWERSQTSLVTEPDTRALAAAGRRVGLASVVLALCVPLFVPGLHTTRLFGAGTPGIGGVGGSAHGVSFPDPQTQVSKELRESRSQPVLEYRSSDGAGQYIQIYVLDDLTDSGWRAFSQPESLVPASPTLPAIPGLTSGDEDEWATRVTTRITISKDVSQDAMLALPAPYPAVTVSAPGQVLADKSSLMIFDNGATLGGLGYSVTSMELDPASQALAGTPAPPRDITSHYLEVPSSYSSLSSQAKSVVAGAKTPFAEAVALQEWLGGGAGGFSYTLTAPTVTNASGLKRFLQTRSGYCQQFSFAMAVLARLVGIPSRIAYGYTSGTVTGNGTWQVTTHDAHAWPELYFQGLGWLRFEPTPAGAGGQGTATSPSYTQQPAGVSSQKTSPTSSGTLPTSPSRSGDKSVPSKGRLGFQDDGFGEAAAPAANRAGLNPWELAGLSLLGLLVLAAVAPGCARLVIRRRRWRAGARGGDTGLAYTAWRELRDDLMDYRSGYAPSESPRALASRVSADLGLPEPAAVALRRITMAEERARYSARPVDGGALRQDSTTVRRAIATTVPRRARWRARLLPSSVLTPVGIGVSQVTDLFSRVGPEWRLGKDRQARQVGPTGA